MQADFADKLKQALSSERLAAYQQRLGQDGSLNLFIACKADIVGRKSTAPSAG